MKDIEENRFSLQIHLICWISMLKQIDLLFGCCLTISIFSCNILISKQLALRNEFEFTII